MKKLVLFVFFLLISSYSTKIIHAQEAVEIPGPDLEDASFVPVGDLKIGDWVFVKGEEGNLFPEQITGLDYHQEEVEVYNLSVEGEETFFANDFAVHNKAGTDTTKPRCQVIVNPTTSNVNSLVKNRSFESPIWRRHEMNCPNNWYNRADGGKHDDQLWCDYGLAVVIGGRAGTAQRVVVGYPHFSGFQIISGLKNFGSQAGGVLYKTSAYGRTGRTGIGFGNHWQFICRYSRYDCNSKNWDTQGVLGWTDSGSESIWLKCYKCDEETGGTELDHISFQEMIGATQVDGINVNLYVAHKDDRQTRDLRHYNEGEPAPGWGSGDPRVISFGEEYKESDDRIAHTLSAYGSQKIIVEVRDGSGNVGTCSRRVVSIAPTGTIIGNVYSNQFGECSDGQVLADWSATCRHEEWSDPVGAVKVSDTQFQCQDCPAGEPCTTDIPRGGYLVEVTAPADYQKAICSGGWAGTGPFTTPVNLDSASEQTQDLYLWQGAMAWFQTKEGDVHAQGGTISSPIYPEDTYFCAADPGDYPGVVSYDDPLDTPPDFGRGDVSEKGWRANDPFTVSYNFDRFYSKLGSPDEDELSTDKLEDYINNHPDQEVFYINGEVIINNKWDFPADRKAIVLIDNDLEVNKEIAVPVGSFLGFIISGGINISGQIGDKTVGPFTGTTAHLHGVYIADGAIDTYYDKGAGAGSGFRLVAAGIFIASDFNLKRDLKDDCTGICNETTPAELFIARPDLFVNIPNELKTSYFFEQEVAP